VVGVAGKGIKLLGEGVEGAALSFRGGTLTAEGHFLERMSERGITQEMISMTVDKGLPFAYNLNGSWRLGFYNSELKVFAGSIEGRLTTTMKTGANYIRNLGGSP
jgi:hypothetical protein